MLQDVLRDLVVLIPAPGSLGSGGPQDAGRGATDRWPPQSRRAGLGRLDQMRAGCGWWKNFQWEGPCLGLPILFAIRMKW